MLYDMLEHRLLAIPPRDSIPQVRMAEYVCRLDSWGSGHSPGPVSGNFCGFEYDPAERTMSLDTVPLLKHTSEARARQLVEDASLAASFFDAIIEQLGVREQLVQAMSRYGASYLSTTMLLFGVGMSYADIARLEGVGEFTSNLLHALLEAMAVQCPYPVVIDSEANTPLAARLSPLMGVSRSSLDARPVKRVSSPNLTPGQGMTFATTRDDLLDIRSRVHASIMRPVIELAIPAESKRLFREYFVNTSEFGRLTELLPEHHGTHLVLFEFTSSDTGAFLSKEQVFVDIRDALRVFVEKCESTAPGGEHYPHKSVVLSGTDSEAVRPDVTLSVPPFLSVDQLFDSGRVTSDHDLCYVCQVQEERGSRRRTTSVQPPNEKVNELVREVCPQITDQTIALMQEYIREVQQDIPDTVDDRDAFVNAVNRFLDSADCRIKLPNGVLARLYLAGGTIQYAFSTARSANRSFIQAPATVVRR